MNSIRSLFFRDFQFDVPSDVNSLLDSENEETIDLKIRQFIENDGSLDKLAQAAFVRLQVAADYNLKTRCLARLNSAIDYTREYRLEQKGQKPPLWQRIRFCVAHLFRVSELRRVEKKFNQWMEHASNGGYTTGELVFYACASGDLSLLEKLTQKKADLRWNRHPDRQTSLHVAAEKGNLAIVSHLITLGVDPFVLAYYKTSTFSGCVTPFMQAILSGQHKVVRYLGDYYPGLMNVCSDCSPLQLATRQNDLPTLEVLISLLEKLNHNGNEIYQQAFKEALSEGVQSDANDKINELLLAKIKDLDEEFLQGCTGSICRAIEKGKVTIFQHIIKVLKDKKMDSKVIDGLLVKGFCFVDSVEMARLLWDSIQHDQTKVNIREGLMLELLKRNPNPKAPLIQCYTNLTIHFFANNSERCPLLYAIHHSNAATLQVLWEALKQHLTQGRKGSLMLQIANRYLPLVPSNHFARSILAPDSKLSYVGHERLAVY